MDRELKGVEVKVFTLSGSFQFPSPQVLDFWQLWRATPPPQDPRSSFLPPDSTWNIPIPSSTSTPGNDDDDFLAGNGLGATGGSGAVGEGNGGFDEEIATLMTMSSERSMASTGTIGSLSSFAPLSSPALPASTTTTGTTNDYVHRTHNIFDMGITVRPPNIAPNLNLPPYPTLKPILKHIASTLHFNLTLPTLNSLSMRYESFPDSPHANNTNNGSNPSVTPMICGEALVIHPLLSRMLLRAPVQRVIHASIFKCSIFNIQYPLSSKSRSRSRPPSITVYLRRREVLGYDVPLVESGGKMLLRGGSRTVLAIVIPRHVHEQQQQGVAVAWLGWESGYDLVSFVFVIVYDDDNDEKKITHSHPRISPRPPALNSHKTHPSAHCPLSFHGFANLHSHAIPQLIKYSSTQYSVLSTSSPGCKPYVWGSLPSYTLSSSAEDDKGNGKNEEDAEPEEKLRRGIGRTRSGRRTGKAQHECDLGELLSLLEEDSMGSGEGAMNSGVKSSGCTSCLYDSGV
ncbi:hypothetical protein EV360DRAFT_69648 [Lentinula raphanica]|nr:hypothetical protein EV360DRAFT_69648 [Lentinula raphanica]